jgi:hypothetical protein
MDEIKENDTLEAKQQEINFLRRIAEEQTKKIEELKKIIINLESNKLEEVKED